MPVRSGFRRSAMFECDEGCGFAYVPTWHGNRMAQFRFRATDLYRERLAQATRRPEQPSTVCKHSIERTEISKLHLPSAESASIRPHAYLDEINDNCRLHDRGSMMIDFAIKQRFLGHGHRDRQWGYNNDDIAACADRQLTDDLGHEAITAADHLNGSPCGQRHRSRRQDQGMKSKTGAALS